MKKFVNDPQQFVPEMLKGIELANPGKLKYVPEYNLIMRTDAPRDDKVSIVQGSGSGHEPAHVMAVGPGMLDAACPGDVFAAPPSARARARRRRRACSRCAGGPRTPASAVATRWTRARSGSP